MKVGRGVLRSLAALSLATCLSAGLGAKAQKRLQDIVQMLQSKAAHGSKLST